jgi:hypothetical protein
MIDPQRELYHALIEGAKNSKYGRDPNCPDQPGTLTRFFTSIADQNVTAFCALLGQLIQHEVSAQTDESVKPQETTTDVGRRLQ